MNVLVLGGDGFLGSHMVDRLLSMGHGVTVFDRFPGDAPQRVGRHGDRIRLVRGEFGATPELREALAGQDLVYHFISATTPGSSWGNPAVEIDRNLRPTLEFLKLATGAGIRKIAFPSSGGTVYGYEGANRLLTEDVAARPVTPYGIVKLAIEGFLSHLGESAGIACDIYRIGNAYGPGQPTRGSQGVIGIWLEKIRRGEAIEIYGDSTTLRDFVYVEDIAWLMSMSLIDLGASGLYNLGTGRGVSPPGLADILRRVIPVPFGLVFRDKRGFDGASAVLDSSRLLARCPGFSFTRLEDGIMAAWRAMGDPNADRRGDGV